MLAEDFRKLLDAANLREPVIVVASSIAGLTAELFARRYPDRVAGLVFLDAANSELLMHGSAIAQPIHWRGPDAELCARRAPSASFGCSIRGICETTPAPLGPQR